jgi:hypothetical protein
MPEKRLRAILAVWVSHYNGARMHKELGLGVPDLRPQAGEGSLSMRHSGHAPFFFRLTDYAFSCTDSGRLR